MIPLTYIKNAVRIAGQYRRVTFHIQKNSDENNLSFFHLNVNKEKHSISKISHKGFIDRSENIALNKGLI